MERRFALPAILVAVVVALALAGVSLGGGRPLHTSLAGPNEVPGPADPDGSGFARITLNQGLGQVCWRIQVSNVILPAIAAHIHHAVAGVAGPIVVPLSPPDATGKSSGCATGVSRALIKAIRQHPADYYVNVHTTDFPAGAVRGQLSK
jgi:hypothetical protein